jgi:hypothetical protein
MVVTHVNQSETCDNERGGDVVKPLSKMKAVIDEVSGEVLLSGQCDECGRVIEADTLSHLVGESRSPYLPIHQRWKRWATHNGGFLTVTPCGIKHYECGCQH